MTATIKIIIHFKSQERRPLLSRTAPLHISQSRRIRIAPFLGCRLEPLEKTQAHTSHRRDARIQETKRAVEWCVGS